MIKTYWLSNDGMKIILRIYCSIFTRNISNVNVDCDSDGINENGTKDSSSVLFSKCWWWSLCYNIFLYDDNDEDDDGDAAAGDINTTKTQLQRSSTGTHNITINERV